MISYRITTDEEHRAALEEIDRLWGAPVGTETRDRLDVLLALVEKYEGSRWPINISDPGTSSGD
jgi:HTH-type transcriptional regulator / antitoxin HigA